MNINDRIRVENRASMGYRTITNIYIDGQFVGYHMEDRVLGTFYGGEVWRPGHEAAIKINPVWHRLGHGACFLSDVIKAAKDYVSNNPNLSPGVQATKS